MLYLNIVFKLGETEIHNIHNIMLTFIEEHNLLDRRDLKECMSFMFIQNALAFGKNKKKFSIAPLSLRKYFTLSGQSYDSKIVFLCHRSADLTKM